MPLLSPLPPGTFLRPPQFSRGQKSEKCIERGENLTETLATQASLLITLLLIFLDVQIVFEGIEGKFIEEESDERGKVNEVEEQRQ